MSFARGAAVRFIVDDSNEHTGHTRVSFIVASSVRRASRALYANFQADTRA